VSTYPSFPELSRAFSLKQSEQTIDPTLRDNYENGMESTRARWTRNRRTFSVALDVITADDKAALDLFFNSTVKSGALPFLLTDPRNLESPAVYTVRFAALPRYTDAGWIGEDVAGNESQYRYNTTFQVREV
jgi:hypothetical protein